MASDAEQLAQWRAQLAREEDAEDSDDDGVGGYGRDDVHVPADCKAFSRYSWTIGCSPSKSSKHAYVMSLFEKSLSFVRFTRRCNHRW